MSRIIDEIDAEILRLKKEISAQKAEIDRLLAARHAYLGAKPKNVSKDQVLAQRSIHEKLWMQAKHRRPQTIKEHVIHILGKEHGGLTAQELLHMLRESYSSDLVRESLSPQLSRLKAEGILVLANQKWHLRRQEGRGSL